MAEYLQPQLGLLDYIQKLHSIQINGINLTELHTLRGTLSGEITDSDGELYELGQEEGGTFDNVADHTAMALVITDVLGEAFRLPDTERGNLNLAAWEHDSGKKTERMWQTSIENHTDTLLQGEDTNLDKDGVRKRVALANTAAMEEWENALAGIPQRANELMKVNVPPIATGHGDDIAAKIMWFADACLSGTRIVPISERFDALESDPKNGKRNTEFSDSYQDKYEGESLYAVQRRLGSRYEEEFAQRLQIQTTDIYKWLQAKVQERIQTQTMPLLPMTSK